MTIILEIDGFLQADGANRPFFARISAPRITKRTEEYFCIVHAPSLFTGDKRIFGIDAEQAKELAVQFLKKMLEEKCLIGKDGAPIDVTRLGVV